MDTRVGFSRYFKTVQDYNYKHKFDQISFYRLFSAETVSLNRPQDSDSESFEEDEPDSKQRTKKLKSEGQSNNCFTINLTILQLFVQFNILPILHFTNFTFYQINILPILHFTKFTFYQFYILPILHFANFTFYQIYILPILHFTNFTFYQFYILPILHFTNYTIFKLLSTTGQMPALVYRSPHTMAGCDRTKFCNPVSDGKPKNPAMEMIISDSRRGSLVPSG
jgi:hypothetical protein